MVWILELEVLVVVEGCGEDVKSRPTASVFEYRSGEPPNS